MRERIRQTYTSLEIGLMQEENEQLKRRLEKAKEIINKALIPNSAYVDYDFGTELLRQELLDTLNGEEII